MTVLYYCITFVLLLVISLFSWIKMQIDFKREIFYGWITIFGFIFTIIWIFYGIFSIIKLII